MTTSRSDLRQRGAAEGSGGRREGARMDRVRSARLSLPRGDAILLMAGWGALIVLAWLWGRSMQADGRRLFLNLPPLTASPDPRLPLEAIVPVAAGVAAVVLGPVAAVRARWSVLLLAAGAGAAGFAFALALTDGIEGLTGPVRHGSQYLVDAGSIGSIPAFFDTFVERIDTFTTHVRSHPPGLVALFAVLDDVGLGGPVPVAMLELFGMAAAVPAVLMTVRDTAGESTARRAAPFVAFAPALVFATTGDGFFTGVGAWAVACLVLATRSGARAPDRGVLDRWAVAGGLLAGFALFLSYGLVLLGAIPLAVAGSRRRPRPLVIGAACIGAVTFLFLSAGFWWGDGLLASRREYLESVARLRPYGFSLVTGLAAFAIILGPGIAVGLGRLRDRRVWLVVGAALVAVAVADLSGMSKGETERIWLPFAIWVMAAGAALWPRGHLDDGIATARGWIGIQVAAALVLQLGVAALW